MPTALSTDLRRSVVKYHNATGAGRILLGRIFGVGSATAYRWVKQALTTGSIEPKTPTRYGCEPKIKDAQLGELRDVVAEKNDRTLQQLCDLWDERKHVLVDDATISLKKKLQGERAQQARRRRKTRRVLRGREASVARALRLS